MSIYEYLPGPDGSALTQVVVLLDGLMDTGWLTVAIVQASDREGPNQTIVKEDLSGKKEVAVWKGVIQRFQTWRPGKLRLLLQGCRSRSQEWGQARHEHEG